MVADSGERKPPEIKRFQRPSPLKFWYIAAIVRMFGTEVLSFSGSTRSEPLEFAVKKQCDTGETI